MCITFIYNGNNDPDSEFSLILASNRDEHYNRPALCMAPWKEDPTIYGGRDMESGCEGGTWLAVAPTRKKIGLLLNLPGVKKENAKSRGKIVEDFIKSDIILPDYIKTIEQQCKDYNDFVFLSIELGNESPIIKSYTNATNTITQWFDECIGFGNSLPDKPLQKVKYGKQIFKDICTKYNKFNTKDILVEELIKLLKNEHRNLPDPQLESRQPYIYKQLSSIFVNIPEGNYGTRTHTILLVSKLGHMDIFEITMQSPINIEEPHWEGNQFHLKI